MHCSVQVSVFFMNLRRDAVAGRRRAYSSMLWGASCKCTLALECIAKSCWIRQAESYRVEVFGCNTFLQYISFYLYCVCERRAVSVPCCPSGSAASCQLAVWRGLGLTQASLWTARVSHYFWPECLLLRLHCGGCAASLLR